MPLIKVPGYGTDNIEKAVADAEADRCKVVQVIGPMAGAWWLLVERPAAAARKAAKSPAKETRA
jgi:hypothetical protein